MEKVKTRKKSCDSSSKKSVISDFHQESENGSEKSVNKRYASDSGVNLRNCSRLKVNSPVEPSVSEGEGESHVITTRSNSFRSSTLAKRARIVHVTRTSRRRRSGKSVNNNDQSKNAESCESENCEQDSRSLELQVSPGGGNSPDIKMESDNSPPARQDDSPETLKQRREGSNDAGSQIVQKGPLCPAAEPQDQGAAETSINFGSKIPENSSESADEEDVKIAVENSGDGDKKDGTLRNHVLLEESPALGGLSDGCSLGNSRAEVDETGCGELVKKESHVSARINNQSPVNGLGTVDESILYQAPLVVPIVKSACLKTLPPAKQNMEKMRMAPMLFMNNLPYMGELTFDTRPRRGRKPKKADICHLISKNYGIQFPNSYVNIPISSPTPRVSTPSATLASSLNLATTHTFSVSGTGRVGKGNGGGKSAKNKLHSSGPNPRQQDCYNNSSPDPLHRLTPSPYRSDSQVRPSSKAEKSANPLTRNNHVNQRQESAVKGEAHGYASSKKSKACRNTQNEHSGANAPASLTWPHHNQIPPDLLPLASANPSLFFPLKPNSTSGFCSSSTQNNAFKRISMLTTPRRSYALPDLAIHGHDPEDDDEDVEEEEEEEPSSRSRNPRSRALSLRVIGPDVDEPLNLCLRDEDLFSSHISQLNLLSQTANLRSNIKPSANNLFNSFNLKRNNKNCKTALSGGTNPGRRGKSFRPVSELPLEPNLSLDIPMSNKLNNNNNSLMHKSNKLRVNNDTDLVNFNIHLSGGPTKVSNFSGRRTFPDNSKNPASPNSQQPFTLSEEQRASPGNHATFNGRVTKGRRKGAAAAGNEQRRSGKYREEYGTDKAFNKMPASETYPTNMQVSQANAAEVSICKFKFTGGAKPSLQEKKMLSVDSTGNFRFYSDKGSPSNQASAIKAAASYNSIYGTNNLLSPSNSHQILAGLKDDPWGCNKSEFLSGVPPLSMMSSRGGGGKPPSASSPSPSLVNLSNRSILSDIQSQPQPLFPPLHLQPSPGDPDCSSSSEGAASPSPLAMRRADLSPTGLPPSFDAHGQEHYGLDNPSSGGSTTASSRAKMKRKRRTRKSLMREKLEKTFKEKGFLIQTQQLESAEGATYCKFRQLRKFTRYLFRSWKDYLPDNLQKIGGNVPQGDGLPQGPGGEPLIPPAPPSLRSDASENLEMDQDSNDNQCFDDEDSPDDLTTASSPNQPPSPMAHEEDLIDLEDGEI